MSRDSAGVSFQSTDALANASEAGAWKSVPHCSERFGLRWPPDKICFQTSMRAFQFVEGQLDSYRTKRSITDGAGRVMCPIVIVFADETAGMLSGQGMASL
jgi:hypothetical protein